MKKSLTLTALLLLTIAGCTLMKTKSLATKPIVIAHRGASGYLPEHTLESYTKAIEMGADFIEPDLVSTKDGVLIARHENEISGTTDVAAKYPKRKTTKTIDGQKITGWFTEDFTLKEIKTLRAKERLASRDQKHNGYFQIPTFEEVIALAKSKSKERGLTVGLYPETKHPTYFQSIHLPLEPKLVKILKEHNLDKNDGSIFIQSFETTNLKLLKNELQVPLVQLLGEPYESPYDLVAIGSPVTYKDMMSEEKLKEIAIYAKGIGPFKRSVLLGGQNTGLVNRAHKQGLLVHPYTFRNEEEFQDAMYEGDPQKEYQAYLNTGIDGLFSDFPDEALKARAIFLQSL